MCKTKTFKCPATELKEISVILDNKLKGNDNHLINHILGFIVEDCHLCGYETFNTAIDHEDCDMVCIECEDDNICSNCNEYLCECCDGSRSCGDCDSKYCEECSNEEMYWCDNCSEAFCKSCRTGYRLPTLTNDIIYLCGECVMNGKL